MTVLAPGIGGSVGNATYQLARAQGAGKVISTAGSAAKAAKARELGFDDVIDLSAEGLADGVRRITDGKGVDIVIESIGGAVTSEALSSPRSRRCPDHLGLLGRTQDHDRCDGPDLEACADDRLLSFRSISEDDRNFLAEHRRADRQEGSVKPIVERVYPFGEAGEALRHLIEDRPFGKVVLAA